MHNPINISTESILLLIKYDIIIDIPIYAWNIDILCSLSVSLLISTIWSLNNMNTDINPWTDNNI